jgi:hypothetical protein
VTGRTDLSPSGSLWQGASRASCRSKCRTASHSRLGTSHSVQTTPSDRSRRKRRELPAYLAQLDGETASPSEIHQRYARWRGLPSRVNEPGTYEFAGARTASSHFPSNRGPGTTDGRARGERTTRSFCMCVAGVHQSRSASVAQSRLQPHTKLLTHDSSAPARAWIES